MEKHLHSNWSNLPVHKPDADLWERIETELDLEGITNHINQLPKYSPNSNLWNSIRLKLSLYQYFKYLVFTGTALLLVFVFFLLTDKSGIDNTPDITQTFPPFTTTNTSPENPGKPDKELNAENTKPENKNTLTINSESPIYQNFSENKNEDNTNIPITFPTSVSSLLEKSENKPQTDALSDTLISTIKELIKEIDSVITSETEPEYNDTVDINPNRKDFKTLYPSVRNRFSSIGIDYSLNRIYNLEPGFNPDNQTFGQYGITYKYHFSNLLIQLGINYNQFARALNYNSIQQLNQFKTYNYVDSVIYNSQGEIIQYITHPVTINDSLIFQKDVHVTKTYSVINLPVLTGYYWKFGKASAALKAGFMCSFVFFEKEETKLPEDPLIKVLKIYPNQLSVNKFRMSGVISTEFDWLFTKRWGFSLESVMQYYFKPFYKETDPIIESTKKNTYTLGVKMGLFYNF